MTNEVITIREMCETYDVTARALRFYETKDLLHPERQGNKRLYDQHEQRRLKAILRGKKYGFSLEEIHDFLEINADGQHKTEQTEAVVKGAVDQLAKLKAERDRLNATITDLQSEIDNCDHCHARTEH